MILGFVLLLGVGVFLFAMWWDASDRARLTRRSDVAFWLHLLAAPMIAHPIFTLIGLNNGTVDLAKALVVVGSVRRCSGSPRSRSTAARCSSRRSPMCSTR